MRTRILAPAGLAVVTITLLAGCTTASAPSELDRAAAALHYVELLRGENDLAHGSLDVPSSSSLPALAAVSAALRQAGQQVPPVSREALEELTRRSGEDAVWATFYLCEATSGDIPLIAALVPETSWPTPPIDSVNAAADRIMSESARACLGLPSLLGASDWRELARQSAGNALVAARLAALARRIGHDVPGDLLAQSDVALIERAVEGDGCTEWVLANSAAAASLVPVPAVVETCAASDTVTISDPTVLGYLVAAEVPGPQLARLLAANTTLVDRALAVETSIASPGSRPTGNGTIASSRDAVLLLRLRGSARAPEWLARGVIATTATDLNASDTVDALYLCAALEIHCPGSFLRDAREATLARVRDALTEPDDGSARAVEAAIEARLELPDACTRERAETWLVERPQLLAAFAGSQKECVEILDLDAATLTPLVRDAFDELRLDDALAYCLLHLLAGDARPVSSEFSRAAREGFADLRARLDAENGDDYLASARPLRIELAQAKEDQWLD